MAVAGTLQLTGRVTGTAGGPIDVALQWVVTDGSGEALSITVDITPTTVALPAKTSLVHIIPPVANLTALTLNTDTPLRPNAATVWAVPAGTASFTLTATGAPILGVIVRCF